MIHFDNVGKAFKNRRSSRELVWPLRNFTASIRQGESTAILVPQGGGKTTLIDMVAGTENPTEGQIIRTGHISWPAGFRGMINPRMTARQNLRFLSDTYGYDFRAALDFVQEFAELGRNIDQVVKQCTNEQRQRLAMSLLLAMNFEFILVDDTFEAGDASFRRKVSDYLDDNKDNLALFMATGSVRLAQRYCSRIGLLTDGQITFYEDGDEAAEIFRAIKRGEA